ncbi:MAG: TIGR04053 family radical SAM/SPASM domain-containing protein [Verrucomicrobiota bacterium]
MNTTPFHQRPYMVVWEVTRACALACRHCRAEAQVRAHPEELSTEEGFALLDQIERAKPELVIFTGGDPMRRKDILDLIGYASRKNKFRVALSPSATPRLLKTDFQKLKNAGVRAMSLSIDGHDREAHDAFRGVKSSWDWTMAAIQKAKEAGIFLQINTTVSKHNFQKLDEFRKLLDTLQPDVWSVFLLIPTGRGKQEISLNGEEMENLFLKLFEISKNISYKIKTTEGQHYRRILFQQRGQVTTHTKRVRVDQTPSAINDGKGFVFVSHTGEICPSGFLPIVAGNIRREELIDVYRNHPVFQQLRSPHLLKGKCGACEFNSLCGGSRARAYAFTGDYLAQEPCCIYNSALEALPPNLRKGYRP